MAVTIVMQTPGKWYSIVFLNNLGVQVWPVCIHALKWRFMSEYAPQAVANSSLCLKTNTQEVVWPQTSALLTIPAKRDSEVKWKVCPCHHANMRRKDGYIEEMAINAYSHPIVNCEVIWFWSYDKILRGVWYRIIDSILVS